MSDFPPLTIPPLPANAPPTDERFTENDFHARMAAASFNDVWRLLEKKNRTPTEIDQMIHQAHASRMHWQYVGDPVNWVVGEWQISRVYTTLRRAEPAVWHARRAVELAHEHKVVGFYLASTYEGMARALRLYPNEQTQAEAWLAKAKILLGMLDNEEEKKVLTADIETNAAPVGES